MPVFSRRARNRAYINQLGRCFYCEFLIWLDCPVSFARRYGITLRAASGLRCTAEHLIPVSEGGTDDPENIVAVCFRCNQARHRTRKVRTPSEHAAHVARRVVAGRWHVAHLHNATALRGAHGYVETADRRVPAAAGAGVRWEAAFPRKRRIADSRCEPGDSQREFVGSIGART